MCIEHWGKAWKLGPKCLSIHQELFHVFVLNQKKMPVPCGNDIPLGSVVSTAEAQKCLQQWTREGVIRIGAPCSNPALLPSALSPGMVVQSHTFVH